MPARGRRLRLILIDATATALAMGTVVGVAAGHVGWRAFVDTYGLTNLLIGAGFFAAGATISWFRVRNTIGVLLQGSGLGLWSRRRQPCSACSGCRRTGR
jgi:hypothetical protein